MTSQSNIETHDVGVPRTSRASNKIGVIGVPLDFGSEVGGVGLGPAAMRVARLNRRIADLGYEVRDIGDMPITRPTHEASPEEKLKYLPQIKIASENLATAVLDIFQRGEFPIVIGGDHAVAIGTLSGVAAFTRTRSVGLIWFDAHGDMNTPETTPSGNIHGMPLAAAFGYGAPELTHVAGFAPKLDPRFCVHVGARELDAGERALIRRLNLRTITMREIDERGMKACMDEAIEIVSKAEAGFHVTLDVDVLDPTVAPGSGTVVRGGLTYREAHLAMEKICEAGRLISLEVVEINTTLDINNRTAELGVELILSALGKTIL